jgi:hypothetical protein
VRPHGVGGARLERISDRVLSTHGAPMYSMSGASAV